MTNHHHKSWRFRLAIILLLVLFLMLVGGCAAPLLGTDQPESGEPATPAATSQEERQAGANQEQKAATPDSEVEDMEIEPEDILEGAPTRRKMSRRHPLAPMTPSKTPGRIPRQSSDQALTACQSGWA